MIQKIRNYITEMKRKWDNPSRDNLSPYCLHALLFCAGWFTAELAPITLSYTLMFMATLYLTVNLYITRSEE